MARLDDEFALIGRRYAKTEVGPDNSWIVLKDFPLPNGWNQKSTDVLVLIPPGYPVTPPDNFYAENSLRLSNDQLPGSASVGQSVAGKSWLQFSYHIEAGEWKPSATILDGHNLQTFILGIERRLNEVS